jgi:hypothetical protein
MSKQIIPAALTLALVEFLAPDEARDIHSYVRPSGARWRYFL